MRRGLIVLQLTCAGHTGSFIRSSVVVLDTCTLSQSSLSSLTARWTWLTWLVTESVGTNWALCSYVVTIIIIVKNSAIQIKFSKINTSVSLKTGIARLLLFPMSSVFCR